MIQLPKACSHQQAGQLPKSGVKNAKTLGVLVGLPLFNLA